MSTIILPDWCFEQHAKTNHFYDKYLPYEFHLRMAYVVFQTYSNLLDDKEHYWGDSRLRHGDQSETLRDACEKATWGHDLIEDCRVSYNDVKNVLGQASADIIFAVTNFRGKTREERAPNEYYSGIVATKGATFVKLCDRIANVQYSKLTKSRQYKTYEDEQPNFVLKLGGNDPNHPYAVMFEYLNDLFK